MAFPAIEGTITISNTGGDTTHTVVVPGGIQAGELLIALFCSDDDESDIGWPGDWIEIFDKFFSAASPTVAIAYKIATGSESDFQVTTPSSEATAHMVFRVSGHDSGQAPEVSTGGNGSSTTPDPDSLTPTGGAKDYLWIAIEGNDDGTDYPIAWPTNYDDNQTISQRDTSAGACISIATRNRNTDVENPGAFTLDASERWIGITLAVHPANGVAAIAPTAILNGPLVGPLGGPI